MLKYLNHVARAEPNLQSPIRDVFEKHLSKNAVVNCLLFRNGTFFEYIKQTSRSDDIEASTTTSRPDYVPSKVMSLLEFINIETISRQEDDDSFIPLPYLKTPKCGCGKIVFARSSFEELPAVPDETGCTRRTFSWQK